MFGRKKIESNKTAGPEQSESTPPFGGKRFLCRPLVTSRLDSYSRLVHVPGSTAVGEIQNELLALTESLQSWATFDEHLAALESAGLALTGHEFASALERIQQLGALWFADDFLTTLGNQQARPAAPISSFVWCTRDRPSVLARSLESFLSKGLESRSPRIIVCDDSTDPEAVRKTAEAVKNAAPQSMIPAERRFHVTMEQKRRIIASLSELGAPQGISPEVVGFILENQFRLPLSEGANRNFALLLTAGEVCLSTDDDTLALAAYGDTPKGLELSSAAIPTVMDFFASDEQCLAAVPAKDCSIMAEHERFLGKGVGDIVRGSGGSDIVLSSCTSHLAHDLVSSDGGVVLTSAGALGDSGFGNPRMIFHLDGKQRERYVQDTDAYEALRLSRVVFRRAECPVITNSPWLMALNYGVDNRDFVPPTFPFGRNSDGLLGVLLRACRPSDFFLHLPFGIRHIPPEPRSFSESDLHAFVPRICDFMIHAAEAARMNPLVRASADRVSTLASYYRALGSLSLRAFDDATRSIWMSFAEGYISNMEMQLNEHGHAPEPWAADVEQHLDFIQGFLRAPGPLLPHEIAAAQNSAATSDEQLELFRKSVRLFGEALDAWPTLREIAQRRPLI
ncbi:MAG: hypothetical protein ABSG21_11360 [Spirochaetia bacterium]|jgi:hypothetical protein